MGKRDSFTGRAVAAEVARRLDIPRAEANRVFDAVIATIRDKLSEGYDVRISGFGTLKLREFEQPDEVKAGFGKTGMMPNPRAGQTTRTVKFVAAGDLKRRLNPWDDTI